MSLRTTTPRPCLMSVFLEHELAPMAWLKAEKLEMVILMDFLQRLAPMMVEHWEQQHQEQQHQGEQQHQQNSAFLLLPLKWMML